MRTLLVRAGLVEYARRPLNVVLLVLVPVVFVAITAGALADFAEIFADDTDSGTIEAATAGWAAAMLAGVAGFFHVSGSRGPDRRLAAAGAGAWSVVVGRLASALVLAALAAAGGLAALALRTGLADVPRVVGATALIAVVYVGIGAAVGAWMRSEMNGSLVVVFVWFFDVFLGPSMMGGTSPIIRVFPIHFPTLVLTDAASGHAGPLGNLGMSLAWAAGALALAVGALVASTRPAVLTVPRVPGALSRLGTGIRYAFREYRRNPALWVLLAGLPLLFITVSVAVTPDAPTPVELVESGRRGLDVISMADLHGAIMVPITVGFLGGLAGLFVVLGSAEGDRRLALAGFRVREILGARGLVIGFAALLTTAVALAVTAFSFTPEHWGLFATSTVLVAFTYALVGVLVGPLFGRLGGLYLMLLLPFIDIGLAQNAMLYASPPSWAEFLPSYGAVRVLMDGAFTTTFDEVVPLVLALGWLVAVGLAATAVFRHLAAPRTG
jgi:hypothetical protein